jgi:hypothetical protein
VSTRHRGLLGCSALTAALLAACNPAPSDGVAVGRPQAPASAAAAASLKPAPPMKTRTLTIYGYNYTDRYIDSFRVNGQGGGNLFLSAPNGGGGKGVCCVSWWPGTKLPKMVRIDWVGSYCKQRLTNSSGESRDWTQPIWKTAWVEITGPVPAEPNYFEVHIYNGDRVEVALTETWSRPRVILPEGDGDVRPGTTANDPPCPPDYDRVREFMRLDEPSLNHPPKPKEGTRP